MAVEANACTAHAITAPDQRCESRAAPSFTTGPAERAEHLIGELFGWEFARSTEVAPAIFPQLLARYLRGDPVRANYPELAPSPAVDRCLNRLVAIARSEFDPPCSAPRLRSPLYELEVRECLIARIRAEPELSRRAHTLRNISAIAETAMEHHYSARLLERLRASSVPRARAPYGPERMQRLAAYLSGFPYIASYVHLVSAELALLETAAEAILVRDRELAQLSAARRDALRMLRAQLRVRPTSRLCSVAVCGAGPLPISGLMLHAWTGARVTLLDLDPRCVERAWQLIGELERLRVLDEGAVRVLACDAADVPSWQDTPYDLALVASLVPDAAKLRLARAFAAADGCRVPALLLRSAQGLCASLLYEPVATHEVSTATLPFCGESVPAHQVIDGLDPLRAAQLGVTAPASRELVAIAHPSVLNTSELYRAPTFNAAQRA